MIIFRFVKPGATVAEFDKICEVQSDKASVEISSRYAGTVKKVYYGQNEVAKVGSPLVDIETDDDEEVSFSHSGASADSTEIKDTSVSSMSSEKPNYYSSWETPAVRRLLHEYGLDVDSVNGSGKNGRVLKGDVLKLIKSGSLEKKGIH